jgi:hypothetical protein
VIIPFGKAKINVRIIATKNIFTVNIFLIKQKIVQNMMITGIIPVK